MVTEYPQLSVAEALQSATSDRSRCNAVVQVETSILRCVRQLFVFQRSQPVTAFHSCHWPEWVDLSRWAART